MRFFYKVLAALCLLSAASFAQSTATITGHISDPTNTAVTAKTLMHVELISTGGNQCRVGGITLVTPYAKDFSPTAGAWSFNLIKNSSLTCGTTTGASRWKFTVFYNGQPQNPCVVNATGNVNLDSTACLNATGTIPATAPTASLFWLLDGSNSPTGNLVPAVNGTQSLGTSGSRWNMLANTLDVTGATTLQTATAKTFQGTPHCKDFATPGVTSFDAMMTACVAALPATGTGTVNATDVTDATNLTMTANWTMSRSGTSIYFGEYTVTQAGFSVIVPSPTSNVYFKGIAPFGGTPALCIGTCFKYTGSGLAHQFGDSSNTSYGHVIEDIAVDMTSATGSAIAFTSTRVYGAEFNRNRGYCSVAANSVMWLQNNGTALGIGSQSMTLRGNVVSSCQIGFQNTGNPTFCNAVQMIGGQYSGNSAAGSIALDIQCGNQIDLQGPYIGGYDHGLKVTSTANSAVRGFVHVETCGTEGVLFGASSANSFIWADTNCTVTDSNGSNTVIKPAGNLIFSADGQLNRIRNSLDLPINLSLDSGTTASQEDNINFQDRAVTKWTIKKQSGAGNALAIIDAAGNNNVLIAQAGSTVFAINAPFGGAGAVDLNATANSGTTGTRFWSGGSAPVQIATFGGGTTPVGSFLQPVNKVGQASIVANSAGINTTETIIVKSAALAANRLVAGTHIRATLIGTCTTTVANTSSFLVRMGTNGTTADTAIATATTGVAGTTGTAIPFKVVIDFTVRTVGASGTGFITAALDSNGTTGIIATTGQLLIQPSMSAFNTTTASNIISFSYVSAATTTTSTFNQAVIEVVYQ